MSTRQVPAARPRSLATRTSVKTDEIAPPTSNALRNKPSVNNIAQAGNAKTALAGKQSVAAKVAGTGGVTGAKRSAFGNVTNRDLNAEEAKKPHKAVAAGPQRSRSTSAQPTVASSKPRTTVPKTSSTSAVTGRPALQPAAHIINRPTAPLPRHAARTQPKTVIESTDDEVEHEYEPSEVMDIDSRLKASGSGLTPSLSGMKTMEHAPEAEASSEQEDEEDEEDDEDWLALNESQARAVEQELHDVRSTYADEVDLFDTTMVAEYADDIFMYMEQLEESVMPNPRYMDFQTEIEWTMRTTLIDWLLQVHLRYHMLPETLWIAVNLVDRFLSIRVVSLVKLQLVGVTAMFIAAKYEEILAPSVDEFVYMTENGYTKDEILKGERIILQTLDFSVSSYCSPYSWVRRISKADDYDIQTRTLSKFLMEVTLMDHRFLRAKPSLIAAIGMYLARRMLNGSWDESFVFYSGYTETQILPGAQYLCERLVEDDFEGVYVYKKYANKKFLRASQFAREWALTHDL